MLFISLVLSFCFTFDCVLSRLNNGTRSVPSLKLVVVVSKHGARAPTHTYSRDPYRDKSLWPDGPGQITKAGKQQMYSVGKKLRLLYNGYLSEFYERTQILAQSTLVDRTMISAATLLAGLYPPREYQLWNPDVQWQPVPVYPNLMDKTLLSIDPSHCPRYIKEQNHSLEVLREENSRYGDIYDAISKGSGRNLTTCSQMYLLCSNLGAVVENNLPLPNWAENIFSKRMLPVVSRMVRLTTLGNVKMIKILSGLFLSKILEMMMSRVWLKADKEQDLLRLFLHVGHDITIMCVLAAVGITEGNIPWASTTLLIELHRDDALPSKYEVQVLKLDGRINSTDIPEQVEMPYCKAPCDLNVFASHMQKYTTRDWQKECQDMTSPSDE